MNWTLLGARMARAPANFLKQLVYISCFFFVVCLISYCELPWANPLQRRQVDFDLFLLSGRAALSGQNPYGPAAYIEQQRVVGDTVYRINAVNLNPPLAVVVFEALSGSDRDIAFRLRFLVSLALNLTAIGLLVLTYWDTARPLRLAWACGIGGLWETLYHGQVYSLLAFAVTLAWILLHRGNLLASGILIGLAASVKPQFLLWPFLIALARRPQALLSASTVALLLAIVPLIRFGPAVYLDWIHVLTAVSWVSQPGNASLAGFTARLGMQWIGTIASVMLLCAAALWAWRRQPAALTVSAISLVTILLGSPISWTTYIPLPLPIPASYILRLSLVALFLRSSTDFLIPKSRTLVSFWRITPALYYLRVTTFRMLGFRSRFTYAGYSC